MAKKSNTTTPTTSTAAKAVTEIDAIFSTTTSSSSQSKSAVPPSTASKKSSSTKSTEPNAGVPSQADKKRKRDDPSSSAKPKQPKTRSVEIVNDTSTPTLTNATLTTAKPKSKGKPKERVSGGRDAELDEFTDSRGTARRRTEDGLRIFTAEELKLGQGGDTEDCPFDCQCCTSHPPPSPQYSRNRLKGGGKIEREKQLADTIQNDPFLTLVDNRFLIPLCC